MCITFKYDERPEKMVLIPCVENAVFYTRYYDVKKYGGSTTVYAAIGGKCFDLHTFGSEWDAESLINAICDNISKNQRAMTVLFTCKGWYDITTPPVSCRY